MKRPVQAPSARPVFRFLLALCLLLAAAPARAAETGAPETEATEAAADADAAAVTAALQAARDDGRAFHLLAECTDDKGHRSLEVFPSGVAIWTHAAQITVPDSLRQSLLDTLLDRGFAGLEPSYGGSDQEEGEEEWEGEEKSGKPRPATADGGAGENGAVRVRCRLVFDSGEVHKTSIQQAHGEQSPKLLGLLASLLDQAEPRAAEGVRASSLADGLAKLQRGELAPETFYLRFVHLPPPGSPGDGEILLVDRGVATRQPYAPGRELGEGESGGLSEESFRELVKRIARADLPSLPGNLWAADHQELEVRVLDRRTTVLARPFSRLSREEARDAQGRLRELASFLRSAPGVE